MNVATLRQLLPRYVTGEKKWHGRYVARINVNELVVESQYLLKLQSGKITKIPRLVTAKCPLQMSCCQLLDAFSRAQSVTNAFGGRALLGPAGRASALP